MADPLLEDSERWPELAAALENETLSDVADRFGLAPAALKAAQRRLKKGRTRLVRPEAKGEDGLPPEPGEASPPPKPARKKKRRYAANAAQILAEAMDVVGKVPDRQAAEKLGVSASSVANFRKAHGIPAAGVKKRRSKRVHPRANKPRPSRITPFAHLVGQVADRIVAEKAGVTPGAVQLYRNRRDIPPAPRPSKPPPPAAAKPEARPPEPRKAVPRKGQARKAPTAERYVWQVLGTEGEKFVVAADLVGAAERAEAAGLDGGLRRVGRAL